MMRTAVKFVTWEQKVIIEFDTQKKLHFSDMLVGNTTFEVFHDHFYYFATTASKKLI
jgi:hypothetical protein